MSSEQQLPARRWWRFSIRELLLLTAAVGAFLAWAGLLYQRSRPYERTAIPDRIADLQEIQNICRTLGHSPSSFSSGGGGSSNQHETTRTHEFRIDLPRDQRGPFMDAYRQHILDLLNKHADGVWGAGATSDGQHLRGFEYDYGKGATRGHVIVRTAGGDDFTLLLIVYEHDTKP